MKSQSDTKSRRTQEEFNRDMINFQLNRKEKVEKIKNE